MGRREGGGENMPSLLLIKNSRFSIFMLMMRYNPSNQIVGGQ